MGNIFHKDFTGDDNHALIAATYADNTARDADTLFQVAENLNKMVRVESPIMFFILTSIGPSVWSQTFTDPNAFDQFLDLLDTPSSYSGEAGQVAQVNAGEDAIEFGSGAGWVVVGKSADEVKSNDTVLATDTELKFEGDENGTYGVRVFASYLSIAQGFTYAISGPAGATGDVLVGAFHSDTSSERSNIGVSNALAKNAAVRMFAVYAIVRLAGTAGTVSLQWAQTVGSATPTTVFAGGYLEYRKVD